MHASLRPSVALGLGLGLLATCDRRPSVPPALRKKYASPPAIDATCIATVLAGSRFTIPNIALVLQVAPTGSDATGISLVSTAPGPDGSRLIFGTFEESASLESLEQTSVHFSGGGPTWMPGGNGIFTAFAAYKPKLATMQINHHSNHRVRGTIEGTFYRWPLPQAPVARPTIVEVRVSFTAAVVIR